MCANLTEPCKLCGVRAVIGRGFGAPCSGSPSGTHQLPPLPLEEQRKADAEFAAWKTANGWDRLVG